MVIPYSLQCVGVPISVFSEGEASPHPLSKEDEAKLRAAFGAEE